MKSAKPTLLSHRRIRRIVIGALSIAGLSAVGLIVYQSFWQQHQFEQGLEAYKQRNCDRAIAQLQPFANAADGNDPNDRSARAKAIQAECDLFQSGKRQQQVKQVDAALVTYTQFASRYPDSPLMPDTKQEIAALFNQSSAVMLAKLDSCKQLDTLTKQQLVPQPETNLPPFYYACGQVLATNKNYTVAIAVDEKFLDLYPNHALAEKVKNAYAQALFADAQAKGSGTIEQPGFNGFTNDGSTAVEIRNDSPEDMRIVFGGPSPRVEHLPPCKGCQVFQGNPPSSCPGKGPIKRYTLEPGNYQVVVKSLSNPRVYPFTGSWVFAGGTQYSHCFYLVHELKKPGETQ